MVKLQKFVSVSHNRIKYRKLHTESVLINISEQGIFKFSN